jgi:hypothetical protein
MQTPILRVHPADWEEAIPSHDYNAKAANISGSRTSETSEVLSRVAILEISASTIYKESENVVYRAKNFGNFAKIVCGVVSLGLFRKFREKFLTGVGAQCVFILGEGAR